MILVAHGAEFERLITSCLVRVSIGGRYAGTAFSVAPGWLLTCAHVVGEGATELGLSFAGRDLELAGKPKLIPAECGSHDNWAFPDLALLPVWDGPQECVWLDDRVPMAGEPLIARGFSRSTIDPNVQVDSLLVQVVGPSGRLIRVQGDEVVGGMSGSPVVSLQTGRVVGITKASRDTADVRGGWIIPIDVIREHLHDLVQTNRDWHGASTWRQLIMPASAIVPAAGPVWVVSHTYDSLISPSGLVGREMETARLSRFLAGSGPRDGWVLVVRAIGGMGKTALVWDRLHREMPEHDAVVWWSLLEIGAGVDALLEHLARFSGGALGDRLVSALEAVRSRKLLIVLDGLERQLEAFTSMSYRPLLEMETPSQELVRSADRRIVDARLRSLLLAVAAGGPSRMIVTSRLMPADLEAAPGVPRGGVELMDLGPLSPAGARKLLLGFGVPYDVDLIWQINKHTGLHPLLLEMLARSLAAGRLSATDLVGELPKDVLEDLAAVQAKVMGQLLDELDERERQVARIVAAFIDPPRTDEIDSVLGRLGAGLQAEPILGRLNDLGIIVRKPSALGATRWSMHLVVKGALRTLTTAGGDEEIRQAVGDEFRDAPVRPFAEVSSLLDLRPQIQLFHIMCDLGRYHDAANLYLNSLERPLMFRTRETTRRLELLGRLFPQGWRHPAAVEDIELRRLILNAAALAFQWQGRNKQGAWLLRDAIGRVEELAWLPTLQSNLASILLYTDELEAACRAAVISGENSGKDRRQLAISLSYLALILQQAGMPSARAGALMNQVGRETLPPSWLELRNGDIALWQGRPSQALFHAQRSLEHVRKLAVPFEASLIEVLRLLGQSLVALGRIDEALVYLEDALRRVGEFTLVQEELPVQIALAQAVGAHDPERAVELLMNVLERQDIATEYRYCTVDALTILGELYQRHGRLEKADEVLYEAYELAGAGQEWCYAAGLARVADLTGKRPARASRTAPACADALLNQVTTLHAE